MKQQKKPRKIKLEFLPRYEQATVEGRKTHTARRTRHGRIGDIFEVWDETYQLKNIIVILLRDVQMYFYREEGCKSPAEFKSVWMEAYHEWRPRLPVYLHRFERYKYG